MTRSRTEAAEDWLVATGDFTVLGGMDRANYALAQYLSSRGDAVHLVAHRVAPDLAARRGVVVHAVPRPLGAHLFGAPLLARAARRARRALPGARTLMNGGNGVDGVPTWIHYLHAAYTPDPAASLRARLSAAAGRRYFLAREAAALRAAPLVICNRRVTAEDVGRHYGVPVSKTAVVYYGVDARAFAPATAEERLAARTSLGIPGDRPVAMFVGALGDRRKGFDLLFDAWRSLSAGGRWDADLVVAGAGAEQDAWAARAKAAGLTGLRVLGFRTDIPALLAAADVFVHPARYEAYGLSVHEAICRGVPAIVSATAGVAERYSRDLAPLLLPAGAGAADVAAALSRWKQDAPGWRAAVADLSASWRARTWDHMAADVAAAVEAA